MMWNKQWLHKSINNKKWGICTSAVRHLSHFSKKCYLGISFLLVASALPATTYAQSKVQQKSLPTFSHQEKQQAILEKLQAEAIYDAKTEVSYVFRGAIPSDMDTLAVAARHNIFFAHNDGLLVEIYGDDDDIKNIFAWYGGSYEQVAVWVYKVLVSSNLVDAKVQLLSNPKVTNVNYDYVGYLSACSTWNDPEWTFSTATGTQWQYWLSDADWVYFSYWTDLSHDIDSVDKRQVMNMVHPATDTGIVVNVIDAWAKFSNSNINDHYLDHHDHSYYLIAPDSVRPHPHWQAVTDLIVWEANNSYGGVWVAHDFPYIHHNVINGLWTVVVLSAIYRAQDSIYAYALANPTKKLTVNMSLGVGNDLTLYNKMKQNANLQNHKQVIFTVSTGNSAATHPSWPARRSRSATVDGTLSVWWVPKYDTLNIIAVGAVTADNPSKPIRHTSSTVWSNTGPEVDFVADGHNVNVMYDTSGWYSLGNGTSFSSPIVNGAVAQLWAQDTTANFVVIYNRLKAGAKDLGTTGKDNTYGRWYVRTGTSLKKAVVEDVPTAINCASNPSYTYSFTPKFYNKAAYQTLRKVYYPSGDTVTWATDVAGVRTFPVIINTAKWFSNGSVATNVLKYEFVVDGCTTVIYSDPITISNIATPTAPTTPPTPIITTMPASACSTGGAKIGKLANPTGTVTVTHNSNPTNLYNPVDSSFTYTPVSAPTDTIHVTYNSGLTSTKDSIYTVTSATTPTINITTPTNPSCAGTSVTYTATATNGGASPSYQWKVNGTNVGTSAATYNYTPQNGDVVTCVLTSSLSCVTSATATSAGITMTVTTNVTPSITITASANTICAGTSVTYTATATNGGASPGYQWKVNGANVGTSATTFNYTPQNGDVVTCVLTSSLSCVTSATATSAGITMTVTANVTPSITISASANTICAGTNVTYTATATNGGASPSYQWKVNGVNVGTSAATYNYTPQNGDVVTCVLTSSLSCVTSATATSSGITMTVTVNVTPSITISASANTICTGTSVTYTATATNGGASPSYQWKVNGANVGTSATTYNYTPQNGDVVTCVLTSSLSCVTSATATSSGITMTVTVNVTPSITISASANTICAGTNVTYTATATNGGASPSYQWKVNGANVGMNAATYNYTPQNGDVVTCVLTSSLSCVTSATATSAGITMTVTTKATPSITITASANPSCAGTSVTYTATATNGGASPSYQWKVNGTNVGTSAATYNYTPQNGDVVTCVLTSSLSCVTSATATSAGITMTVNAKVTPSITLSATPSGTVANGTSISYTANIIGATVYSLDWFVDGVLVSNTNSPINTYIHNASAPADTVRAVLKVNGCFTDTAFSSNTVIVVVNGTSGIEDTKKAFGLAVYPNPTNDLLHIKLESGKLENIQLSDYLGRSLYPKIKVGISQQQAMLQLAALPDGLYLLQLHIKEDGKDVFVTEKVSLRR